MQMVPKYYVTFLPPYILTRRHRWPCFLLPRRVKERSAQGKVYCSGDKGLTYLLKKYSDLKSHKLEGQS